VELFVSFFFSMGKILMYVSRPVLRPLLRGLGLVTGLGLGPLVSSPL